MDFRGKLGAIQHHIFTAKISTAVNLYAKIPRETFLSYIHQTCCADAFDHGDLSLYWDILYLILSPWVHFENVAVCIAGNPLIN